MREHEQDDASRHRRSVRLSGYDYATTGAYFVTICTWRRQCLFGNVCEGEVRLNELGLIGRDEWSRTGLLRHNVETETCVVMPNHLHGIIAITSHRRGVLHTPQSSAVARTHLDLASGTPTNAPQESLRSPSETIGAIVRGFKSALQQTHQPSTRHPEPTSLATELPRTRYPKRKRPPTPPPVHPRQPITVDR